MESRVQQQCREQTQTEPTNKPPVEQNFLSGTASNSGILNRLVVERSIKTLRTRQFKTWNGHIMKYICLGYIEPNKFESMSESERNAMLDECFSYDDFLRKNSHFAGGEALQPPSTAKTLQWRNGKVVVTDGPYAETKEQIGGLLILEARDLNHAIQLMSKHPGVKAGPFEIRPAADLSGMVRESEKRRAKA
jgi:hypothetical protein